MTKRPIDLIVSYKNPIHKTRQKYRRLFTAFFVFFELRQARDCWGGLRRLRLGLGSGLRLTSGLGLGLGLGVG